MATSRDDFVIAIRSAFIKKGNKQRFSLIGLIFFSLGLLILSKINLPVTNYLKIALNEIVYRSSFIVSIPEKKIQDFSNKIKDHYNVYVRCIYTLTSDHWIFTGFIFTGFYWIF